MIRPFLVCFFKISQPVIRYHKKWHNLRLCILFELSTLFTRRPSTYLYQQSLDTQVFFYSLPLGTQVEFYVLEFLVTSKGADYIVDKSPTLSATPVEFNCLQKFSPYYFFQKKYLN